MLFIYLCNCLGTTLLAPCRFELHERLLRPLTALCSASASSLPAGAASAAAATGDATARSAPRSHAAIAADLASYCDWPEVLRRACRASGMASHLLDTKVLAARVNLVMRLTMGTPSHASGTSTADSSSHSRKYSLVVKICSPYVTVDGRNAFEPALAMKRVQQEAASLRSLEAWHRDGVVSMRAPMLLALFDLAPHMAPTGSGAHVEGDIAASRGSDWPWPCLVMTTVRGESFEEWRDAAVGALCDCSKGTPRVLVAALEAAVVAVVRSSYREALTSWVGASAASLHVADALHAGPLPTSRTLAAVEAARLRRVRHALCLAAPSPPLDDAALRRQLWLGQQWTPYLRQLEHQRATVTGRRLCTRSLPSHLLAQMAAFLPAPGAMHVLLPPCVQLAPDGHTLLAAAAPARLHGDLTAENIFGSGGRGSGKRSRTRGKGAGAAIAGCGSWRPHSLLDMADGLRGDPVYELPAVFCSTLSCDAAHLRDVVQAYTAARSADCSAVASLPSLPWSWSDVYRLTCVLLLHYVDGFDAVEACMPDLLACAPSWMEVALWLHGALMAAPPVAAGTSV